MVASGSEASFARRPSDTCDDALSSKKSTRRAVESSLLIRPSAFAAYRYTLEFVRYLAVLRLRPMYEFIGREHSGVPVFLPVGAIVLLSESFGEGIFISRPETPRLGSGDEGEQRRRQLINSRGLHPESPCWTTQQKMGL